MRAPVTGALGGVLVCLLLAPSSYGAQEPPESPRASAPRLDGVLGEEEWAGSVVRALDDGGDVRFLRDGARLFVVVRGRGEGWAHVYIGTRDRVRVLHASAALGAVVYRQARDGRWNPTGEFTWRMRDPSLTKGAETARREHLDRRGWVATTSGMGDPAVHEFAIDLEEFEPDARIAVLHATDPSDTIAWPSTRDAVREAALVRGSTPSGLVFEVSTWAKIPLDLEGET